MSTAAPPASGPSLAATTTLLGIRGLRRMRRRPSLFIPTLIMPVFLLITFTGSFRGISDVPGYGTDNVFNWMAAYAVLQGSSFAGVGAAGMVAEDIENGFFDRLLLGPGRRFSLLLGPLLYAIARAMLPTTVVLVVAFTVGDADLPGGPLGLAMVYLASVGTAVAFALLGLNVVYVGRSQRSLLAIQVVIFALLFISEGQVPVSFQTGWLARATELNPITYVLRMARQGFLGDVTWDRTWPGVLALAGAAGVLGGLAMGRLRRYID